MIWAVTMPTWGLSMEQGTLVGWQIAEGGPTAPGLELVEIETSKITNTLEAQQAGVLRRQLAKAGETIACGDLIGIIASEGVSEGEIDAFVAGFTRPRAAMPGAADAAASVPALFVELPSGLRLRYLTRGDRGSVVVFLHGFGGDSNTWLFNQPDIAQHHTTFAFDLPGHGGSTKHVNSGSLAELAGSIGSALDNLRLERIDLVGHSLGAAVALALCELRPARIASVSLIAPFAFGSRANQVFICEFASAQRSRDVQRCLALLFANPRAIRRDMVEAVVQYKRLDGVTHALGKIATSVLRQSAPVEISSALKTLANRMLVIRGRHDNIVSEGQDPPGARVEILTNSGHMPHMEEPERVNALLLEHFAKAGLAGAGVR
jgi:pyruvate dehydrogenase E2 component (dihydrolipoamide acetyltransferase)